jgi:hypothetical protein
MKEKNGSSPFFRPNDWRNLSKLNTMSISAMLLEHKETLIRSDLDVVKEALIAREAIWKTKIEEKNRDLVKEKIEFEKFKRLIVEFMLERIQGEMNKVLMKNDNVGKEDDLKI